MFEVLEGGFEPVRGTKYSAYVDLFASEDCTIGAGCTSIVNLGVKLNIEMLVYEYFSQLPFDYVIKNNINGANDFLKSHYLEVALRSSLGVKGLIIANGIGVIDLDYEGELGLIVHNPIRENFISNLICKMMGRKSHHYNQSPFEIKKGDKVAQCTLKEHKGYLMGYESDTIRDGGFGSTGK